MQLDQATQDAHVKNYKAQAALLVEVLFQMKAGHDGPYIRGAARNSSDNLAFWEQVRTQVQALPDAGAPYTRAPGGSGSGSALASLMDRDAANLSQFFYHLMQDERKWQLSEELKVKLRPLQ